MFQRQTKTPSKYGPNKRECLALAVFYNEFDLCDMTQTWKFKELRSKEHMCDLFGAISLHFICVE